MKSYICHHLPQISAFALLAILLGTIMATSCKVEFSPNAEWKDVPSVYCIIDPQEDTIWARVQRCYLGNDNLYNYSTIADSTNYPSGQIRVVLKAWKGIRDNEGFLTATNQLVDSWELRDTLVSGRPSGHFAEGSQPLFYCTPGNRLIKDTNCVFQLLIINTNSGDTIARATTTLVGFLPMVPMSGNRHDSIETTCLIEPNQSPAWEFGYRTRTGGRLKWRTLPRGRLYQPKVTFYYRKGNDTLSIDIVGKNVANTRNTSTLTSTAISEDRFLQVIKDSLANNRDSLFNVNNVDITIAVCNEELNAYLNSQNSIRSGSQEMQTYTNIEGGVGIFASRRGHLKVNVPCDSNGKSGYLPMQLRNLNVGFYGQF